MDKHFENIWEEAEIASEEYYDFIKEDLEGSIEDRVKSDIETAIKFGLNDPQNFGDILMALCYISKKHNINSWTVLQEAITNCKIDLLEEID